jgi:homoserine kinase type II
MSHAVYDLERVVGVLGAWDVGRVVSATRLPGGYANDALLVQTARGRFVLRIGREQNREGSIWEARVLTLLERRGLPVAPALARRDGSFAGSEGEPPALLFPWVEGRPPQPGIPAAREVGAVLGDLHRVRIPPELVRENKLRAENWDIVETGISGTESAAHTDTAVRSVIERFIADSRRLRRVLPPDLPRGLVHGDVFPDNTLFDGDRLVALLDFEEACEEAFLFDVAVAAHGFAFNGPELDRDRLAALLDAYVSRRPFEESESSSIDIALVWGAHATSFWHVRYLLHGVDPRKLERVVELQDRITRLERPAVRADVLSLTRSLAR